MKLRPSLLAFLVYYRDIACFSGVSQSSMHFHLAQIQTKDHFSSYSTEKKYCLPSVFLSKCILATVNAG